ncbi:MAG: hypothetical protein PHN88_09210 [Ignavibacteria bacterium]|nr:hypothetical protein [Ignavibacteria bacterium]
MATNTQQINVTTSADIQGLKDLQKAVRDARDAFVATSKDVNANADQVKQAGQKYTQAANELKAMNAQLKDLRGSAKMSGQQLLEMYENITVITAGISIAIKKIVELTKEIGKLALEGAMEENMRNFFDKMNGGSEEAGRKFAKLRQVTAGTFTEKEILQYINRLDELGYSTEQSTKILSQSHEMWKNNGRDIQDSTNKIIQFIETGRGRALNKIGIDVSKINQEMERLAKTQGATLKNYDDENLKLLRKEAYFNVMKKSYDDINEKEKTNADWIKWVGAAYEDLKDIIGALIAEGIVPFIQYGSKVIDKVKEIILEVFGGNEEFKRMKDAVIKLIKEGLERLWQIFEEKIAPNLKIFIRDIKNIIEQNPELISALAKVTSILNEMAAAELGFLLRNLGKVLDTLHKIGSWTPGGIVMSILGLDDTGDFTVDENGNYKSKKESIDYGEKPADLIPKRESGLKDTIKELEDINDKIKEDKEKEHYTPTKFSKDKGKEETPEQIEAKTLDAIINKYKDKIKLLDLDKSGNAEIRFERQKALEDAEKELKLNYLSLQYDKNKVKNLDEQDRISKEINKTFGHSIQAQKKESEAFVFSDSKAKRLSPADKNTKAQEPVYDYKKAQEKVQAIMDVATQTVNILGLGADSFIGKMISGFQQVTELADSVVSMLAKLGAIGGNAASGGIFGLVGSLFGFAEGGFTGNLPTNAVAGVVHGGEYVIKASAVTPQTIPLLQAINGANPYSQIAKYASGGYVNRSVNNNNIYLAGTLDGQKFHQVNEKKFRMIQNATMMKG